MNKEEAVRRVYEIATLCAAGPDVMELLAPLSFERATELLLLLRQSSRPVRSPANFLRRAIEEGWTPETARARLDRHRQNIEARYYERRGLSPEAARERARNNQLEEEQP